MAITNIVEFAKLINKSKLDEKYKSLIIGDVIDIDKVIEFDNEIFLKAAGIILSSSIQEDMKYLSIMCTILCLKDNNEQQKKSSIILYALLASYGVISTYTEQTIPHAPCIKRPGNKKVS